jgi:hypothetical protein
MGAVAALRHHALQPHLAGCPEQVRSDLALLEWGDEDAVRPARQQTREVGLADRERYAAQVFAIECEDVEGVELNLVIVLARVQGVEVRDAVDPEHHGLAVDHEQAVFVLQLGRDDPGVTAAPLVAVPGEQALLPSR